MLENSRRPRSTTPLAYADGPHRRSQPSPRRRAPRPWVEAALLTLFEPASQPCSSVPAQPRHPRWLAVWHSLHALYALRLRVRTRRSPAPVETAPNKSQHVTLVETPPFVCSTGLDPGRCVSRAVVFVADLLADAVVLEIVSRVKHPMDALTLVAGASSAYVTADLVSAIYNWLSLNFSPNAALFGDSSSLSLSFSARVAPLCAAVAPIFALMLASPPGAIAHDAFACYFLTFFSLLPAFCAWSAGDLRTPLVVALLQEAGIVVRRSSENCLHTLQYCIVCGLWDGLLTRLRLFSALERWIYLHSGGRIRPRVWDIVPEARVRACGPDDELVRMDADE